MTSYLRNKIPFYIQKAELLQREKTYFLKNFPSVGGKLWKIFSKKTPIDKKPILLQFFESFKDAFSSHNFLMHHSHMKQLFVDINVSKKYGYGVQMYHVRKNNIQKIYANTFKRSKKSNTSWTSSPRRR